MTSNDADDVASRQPRGWSTYTTAAYAQDTHDEAARAAASWLEEQSLHPFIREVALRSLARLAVQAGESVLDVGCGTGVFLPGLAELVGPTGRVVGLDYAPAFLADARERLAKTDVGDRVELVEGDAQRLPFADATFDAAHCERVLMHVEAPDAVIAEMQRVVRPGGRVVVAEPYPSGAAIDGADAELHNRIGRVVVSGIRNPEMGLSLRARFVDAGFTDVSGEVVGFFEEELDEEEASEWERTAREMAATGEVETERVDAAIADLAARRERGAYCGLATMFVVSGRVPEAPA
jgi:ubiquinone/menaquinone biosynthesis C-methylase UbiE